jgi:hypothetical protein
VSLRKPWRTWRGWRRRGFNIREMGALQGETIQQGR